MRFDILTLFPDFFESPLKISLIGKALDQEKLSVFIHDIRDFTLDKHHTVDDTPYGGGAGMVMKPEPLVATIESIPRSDKSLRILLSPRGKRFDQKMASKLAGFDQLILVCGRYEGVDERVKELAIDEEISVGDYILNGGETAALVLLETLVRFIPGFMGNVESTRQESFKDGLLEYPQYTRPPEFRGLKVPNVLQSGHHKEIEKWRREQSLKITKERRLDLLTKKK